MTSFSSWQHSQMSPCCTLVYIVCTLTLPHFSASLPLSSICVCVLLLVIFMSNIHFNEDIHLFTLVLTSRLQVSAL